MYGRRVAAGQAGKAGAAARRSGRGVGLGRRSAAGQGETRGRQGRGPGRLRPWAGKLSGGLLSEMKKKILFISQINRIKFPFLSHLKAFSQIGVKMKFVPFFNIYNFDFMTKAKFLIDFELKN